MNDLRAPQVRSSSAALANDLRVNVMNDLRAPQVRSSSAALANDLRASITSDLQRSDLQLIQLNPLHLVAYELKVALEVFTFDNHRATAIVGVKTQGFRLK